MKIVYISIRLNNRRRRWRGGRDTTRGIGTSAARARRFWGVAPRLPHSHLPLLPGLPPRLPHTSQWSLRPTLPRATFHARPSRASTPHSTNITRRPSVPILRTNDRVPRCLPGTQAHILRIPSLLRPPPSSPQPRGVVPSFFTSAYKKTSHGGQPEPAAAHLDHFALEPRWTELSSYL